MIGPIRFYQLKIIIYEYVCLNSLGFYERNILTWIRTFFKGSTNVKGTRLYWIIINELKLFSSKKEKKKEQNSKHNDHNFLQLVRYDYVRSIILINF